MQGSIEQIPGRPSVSEGRAGWHVLNLPRTAFHALRPYLPRGDALPDTVWWQRHRAILILLWLHVAALPIVGIATGHGVIHSALEASIVAFAAAVAMQAHRSRAVRMVAATFGLISCSALLVHFSGGLIEMHFHFFVMVAVVTLYQSWLPFLVALGYVVVHHGLMGAIEPTSVYNHPAAIHNSWKWALVHGGFILGESAALLAVWRMNEDSRAEAAASYESQLQEEQARREAQQKYQSIFENAIEGIYEARFDTGEVFVNPAGARMLGYASVEEFDRSSAGLCEFYGAQDRLDQILGVLENTDLIQDVELELERSDGTRSWLTNSARAIRDEGGRLEGIQGTLEDVSERKRSEEVRREREEQFRILFESNPLPMWVYDLETLEFLAVNLSAVTHYGYSKEEFLAMRITDIRPDEDVPRLMEDVGKERPVLQRSGPWRHLTKDGRELEVEIRSHTLDFLGHGAALVVVDDVTDRNQAGRQREKLEKQLRQAQKMEAVGQLAGGIAHDFNNLLSVIINYANFVKEETHEDDERRADLEEISKAGERGGKLVKQLLAFSRQEIANPEVLDLNRVVHEMERMLQRTLGEDIDLELGLQNKLWPTKFDHGGMEQILVNLSVNARDAMKQGGKLLIQTSNTPFDDGIADRHPELKPGDHVCLSVSDTGFGMSDEVKARIFEPFFSTKPAGEGTGLGLAMVYGMVKGAGGSVHVYSEPDVGTTFRIYLPVTEDRIEDGARGSGTSNHKGGSETVLLVEDEQQVRDLTSRILHRAGYSVVSAEDGQTAAEIFRAKEGRIDLLLTDVIMPGMTGKELSDHLHQIGDGFRTLYMSGYDGNIVSERGLLRADEQLIQKPFDAGALLHKIRETLER